MYCPNCNLEFDSKFCPECGTKLVERVIMYCPNCNKECDSKFCPDCGAKIVQKTAGSPAAPQAETPPPIPSVPAMSKDQAKEAENLFQMGKKYYSSDDDAKAAEYYEKAAILGHAQAQAELGDLYNLGWGVEKDIDKAFYWYSKSAEQNNLFGLKGVHDYYWKRDRAQSVAYLQRIAEEADVEELIDMFDDWDFLNDWLNDLSSFGKELWEDNKKSMAIDVYKFVARLDSDDEYDVDAISSARQFLRDHGYDW